MFIIRYYGNHGDYYDDYSEWYATEEEAEYWGERDAAGCAWDVIEIE